MPTRIVTKRTRRAMLSRRRFIQGTALGIMGFCTSCAVDAWGVEPEWIEIVETDLPVEGLPPEFADTRVVHITDLHRSSTVSEEYLRRCMQRNNQLKPDLVALTGDYITHDPNQFYRQRVAELMGQLQAPLGVFACLGNHDYDSLTSWNKPNETVVSRFTQDLSAQGITVLRNQAQPLHQGDGTLWLAGLGDLWAKDCDLEKTWQDVPKDSPCLMLAHNPDTVDLLSERRPQAMLCGHTHGGQVRVPLLPPPILPIRNKTYHAGLFNVSGMQLYVNRGLGRLGRIRFNCRPEIAVLTLKPTQA